MPSRISSVVALLPVLAFCAGAGVAQPEPQDQPPRRPDASQFVDRIMSNDKDGDGKITREEMGDGRAARIFEFADENKDDVLEREEVEEFVKTRLQSGPREGNRPPAPKPEAVSEETFHEGMEMTGRALRRLRRSPFDESSRQGDLAGLQRMQQGLLQAKSAFMEAEVSEHAEEEFEGDNEKLRTELRKHLARALRMTLKVELAVLEGDTQAAKETLDELMKYRNDSHDLFEPEEEDDD